MMKNPKKLKMKATNEYQIKILFLRKKAIKNVIMKQIKEIKNANEINNISRLKFDLGMVKCIYPANTVVLLPITKSIENVINRTKRKHVTKHKIKNVNDTFLRSKLRVDNLLL